ncbi:MAG: hypothetical protein AAF431_16125 [Pseudomonadota bacterium]
MATVINLEDIDIESLSQETIELISQLTTEILKISGKGFNYNDPYLLPKIRRRVKRLKDPRLTAMYHDYKCALLKSVNSGQFEVRPYQLINYRRDRLVQSDRLSAMA